LVVHGVGIEPPFSGNGADAGGVSSPLGSRSATTAHQRSLEIAVPALHQSSVHGAAASSSLANPAVSALPEHGSVDGGIEVTHRLPPRRSSRTSTIRTPALPSQKTGGETARRGVSNVSSAAVSILAGSTPTRRFVPCSIV